MKNVHERIRLASTTDSAKILEKLARDKEPEVRIAVAYNLASPYYVLEKLYKDENADVRNAAVIASEFLL